MRHTGGCACGAVRFAARGEGDAAYCHCEDCRRVSGAPIVLWVGFPAGDVELTGDLGERSNGSVVRRFCRTCGSPITYQDETMTDSRLCLAAGAFDDQARLKPTRHAFWDARLPWFEISDDLPKFARFSMAREGREPPKRRG